MKNATCVARPSLLLGALAALALAACGGAAPASNTPDGTATTGGHAHHGELGEKHANERNLPKEVREFHEVLAPNWHAEKGPERANKTCAQATALTDKAAAVQAGPTPEKTDDAAWKSGSKDLTAAVAALVAECKKDGRPDFEAKFSDVHARFHKLTEQLPH